MSDYTDDDVTAAAEAVARWYDQNDTGHDSDHAAIAERVLAAVAPAIAARAYADGESNVTADYMAAFDEWPDLHYREDVDEFAAKVAARQVRLRSTRFAAKVAARALREAADKLTKNDPLRDEFDDGIAWAAEWLRARAEQVSSDE